MKRKNFSKRNFKRKLETLGNNVTNSKNVLGNSQLFVYFCSFIKTIKRLFILENSFSLMIRVNLLKQMTMNSKIQLQQTNHHQNWMNQVKIFFLKKKKINSARAQFFLFNSIQFVNCLNCCLMHAMHKKCLKQCNSIHAKCLSVDCLKMQLNKRFQFSQCLNKV